MYNFENNLKLSTSTAPNVDLKMSVDSKFGSSTSKLKEFEIYYCFDLERCLQLTDKSDAAPHMLYAARLDSAVPAARGTVH